jgi:hypothetical protein
MWCDVVAAAFGPLALWVVRDQMIQDGLARTTINARVNRVRNLAVGGRRPPRTPPVDTLTFVTPQPTLSAH